MMASSNGAYHAEEKCKEVEIIDVPLLLEATRDNSKRNIYRDWSKCCIYRVPKKLRSVNEAAYTPQIVSIGPFHHSHPDLKPMEKLKSAYLVEFCKRTEKSLDELKTIIDPEFEERIRACYAGTHELDSNFAEMGLTDACFIIELMIRTRENREDDYILSKPWLRKSVEMDLILLENQLPLFLLQEAYRFSQPRINPRKDSQKSTQKFQENPKFSLCFNCTSSSHYPDEKQQNQIKTKFDSDTQFLELAKEYFSGYNFKSEDSIPRVNHFTDLLRFCVCPPNLTLSYEVREYKIESLQSATKLNEAGVDFEMVETTYLNNIKFEKGECLRYCPCSNCSWLLNFLPCFFHKFPFLKRDFIPTLKLPRFEVDGNTECVFRNLMALEQCHYPDEAYICNYVSLMDKLINTRDDVDLLIEKKVIVNYLGSSKAAAELFNKLCEQIVEQNSCYYECVEDIHGHCRNPLNRIMATLTSVYFKDFWRGTATIVGLVVLILSVWNFVRILTK